MSSNESGEEPAAASAETLTLVVRDQANVETQFKVKKSTKMKKIFAAFASKNGVQLSSLRFLLDGAAIDGEQTPKMLELEDGDQIDCFLEQTGG